MACYPWSCGWEAQSIDINEFKYVRRWLQELGERPALQKGMAVGSDLTQDYSKLTEKEVSHIKSLLYNQRARPAPESGGIQE
jgi:GST-like protein